MNQTRGESEGAGAVRVVLVGMSGMGLYYLISLTEEFTEDELVLEAVVDPYPRRSERYQDVADRGIIIASRLEEVFDRVDVPDLVIVASPLQYHAEQAELALSRGCHVLCEKPVAATIQDADRLIGVKESSGCWVRIGYQWSYSAAIMALKKDILDGTFGAPIRLKTFYVWSRDEAYYARNAWAGRIRDDEGRWVLDSPANSAMAHDLHNLFYLIGDREDRSAVPIEVTAEAYRAFPIENYDTVACRATTDNGSEILFYATHAVPATQGPMFHLQFEQAEVVFEPRINDVTAKFPDGREIHYGSPEAEHAFRKLFEAVDAVQTPQAVLCGPEAARSQTLCVNGIQESVQEIVTFPSGRVEQLEGGKRLVRGLEQDLFMCYARGLLPSEAGLDWARSGRTVDLRGYTRFPRGTA